MKKLALAVITAAVVALGVAACSQPAATPEAAEAPMTDMSAAPAVAGPITGVGVVTAVDAAAGTVSLDHEAINAIQWPAMSMQFRAEDPAILANIAVGDRVNFTLKNATETSVITAMQEQ